MPATDATIIKQVLDLGARNILVPTVSTPGIDGVCVGPSDLAASMGHLGKQTHPEVVAVVPVHPRRR